MMWRRVFLFLFASVSLAAAQEPGDEGIRAKARGLMQSLHRRLDAREAAELSLLARTLAAKELESGAVRAAFSWIGPAIYFQERCLASGLGNVDAGRALLASGYESFGVALTHLGEFELAAAAFSFAEEEVGAIVDRDAEFFPPEHPSRQASRQGDFFAIRKASALRAAGNPQRAWEALEALRREGKTDFLDEEGRAYFFSERGNALEDLGRYAEALEDYERARSGWLALGETQRALYERKTSGDALRKAGKPQEAIVHYREALSVRGEAAWSPLESHECHADLALALLDLGREEEALAHLEKALASLEALRRNLEGTESFAVRTRSFATVSKALGAWARIRFEREGSAAAIEVLNRIDRYRGLGVQASLSLPVQRESARAVETDWEKKRSLLRREIQVLSGTPRERGSLRRSLSEIELRLMGIQFATASGGSPAAESSIRSQDVPEGTLLLEYFVSEEELFLWVVSREECLWFSLAKGKEVAPALKAIDRFSESMAQRRSQSSPKDEALSLAPLLLPPEALEKAAAARVLWIVPEANLHRVPWSALFLRNFQEGSSLAILPSAAFALSMAKREASFAPGAAVFANPAIDVEGFDPLRFSESEGRSVSALFSASTLRTGASASEESLKALSSTAGSLLHISAHGIFSRTVMGGSALLLAPSEKEDGWLWASEIQRLFFPGRLVVLSSCYSGVGEWIPGEGVFGLSQAFLAAGARSVIGALWAVDQESTSALMREFYKNLTGGHSVGESLTRAQKEMASKGTLSQTDWAAFCLFGDPSWRLQESVVSPENEKDNPAVLGGSWIESPWIWGFGGAVVLALGVFVLRRAR